MQMWPLQPVMMVEVQDGTRRGPGPLEQSEKTFCDEKGDHRDCEAQQECHARLLPEKCKYPTSFIAPLAACRNGLRGDKKPRQDQCLPGLGLSYPSQRRLKSVISLR